MYSVTFNGGTVYDPRLTNQGYCVTSCKATLEVNATGSMAVVIPPSNPAVSLVTRVKGKLALSDETGVLFRGRVIRDKINFMSEMELTAEGELAYLNDSVVPPYSFPEDFLDQQGYTDAAESGNVVEYFLSWLITHHNETVSEDQEVQLGTVTVTDPNNYISRSSDGFSTTWEAVTEKLVKSSLGGYIVARYESNATYIDYLADLPLTNAQEVETTKNLIDISRDTDETAFYSVVIPIGSDGLTISDLPDGDIDDDTYKAGLAVHSRSREEEYGVISKVIEHEDISDPQNLRQAAVRDFNSAVFPITIQCKAADLHGVDGTIPRFRAGRKVIVKHGGSSETYPLIKLSVDVLNPGKSEIQMSRKEVTLAGSIGETISADLRPIKAKIIKTNAAQQEKNNEIEQGLSSAVTTLTEQITTAVQNSQGFIFEALESYTKTGDLETFKQQVSTQFSQTASQIQLTFNNLTEEITNVSGDLQRKYDERVSYIRFEDGNIILGENGNEITLIIENDRIAFRQNGQEVAWFSNNQFYITDAEVTRRLNLGRWRIDTDVGLAVKWNG